MWPVRFFFFDLISHDCHQEDCFFRNFVSTDNSYLSTLKTEVIVKCIKYRVGKEPALEEIVVSDFIFESSYLALNVKKDASLKLEVQKSLVEFNVCQLSFSCWSKSLMRLV